MDFFTLHRGNSAPIYEEELQQPIVFPTLKEAQSFKEFLGLKNLFIGQLEKLHCSIEFFPFLLFEKKHGFWNYRTIVFKGFKKAEELIKNLSVCFPYDKNLPHVTHCSKVEISKELFYKKQMNKLFA